MVYGMAVDHELHILSTRRIAQIAQYEKDTHILLYILQIGTVEEKNILANENTPQIFELGTQLQGVMGTVFRPSQTSS